MNIPNSVVKQELGHQNGGITIPESILHYRLEPGGHVVPLYSSLHTCQHVDTVKLCVTYIKHKSDWQGAHPGLTFHHLLKIYPCF